MEATRTTHAMDHPLLTRTLAQDGAFVRLLARSLVRDSERADDLVQETWLRFLERTPSATGSLRHWLRTVARNLAASGTRSERSRSEREVSAARPEALPSAADDFEHAELMRNVIDAVLTLDEPYRSTLLARYYRGWSSRRVASETKTPLATVRSREQRALEQLRAKLDREAGGRAAWALALGKLFELEPASLVPAVKPALVGLGAVAGVALVVGLVWSSSRSVSSSVVAPQPQSAAVAQVSASPSASQSTSPSTSAARVPGASAQGNPAPASPAGSRPVAPAPRAEIRARFLFSDGTPAAGVACTLELGRKITRNGADRPAGAPADWTNQSASIGADGSVSLSFVKPFDYGLMLRAELDAHSQVRWEWMDLAPDAVLDLGDVTMLRSGAVTGRLVQPDGTPILGAAWRIDAGSVGHATTNGRMESRVQAQLDPITGGFRIEGVMPGANALKALGPTHDWVNGPRVVVPEGGEAVLDFVCAGPDTARRIRVDVQMERFHTADGPAAEHVHLLGAGVSRTSVAFAEQRGSYAFDDVEPGSYTLEIDDPRCELWRKEGVRPGSGVTAKLRGNSALVLGVFDAASGAPVTGYAADVTLRDQKNSYPNTFTLDAAKLAGGRIDGLFAGDRHVELRAGELVGGADVDALAIGETRTLKIELEPRPSLAGTAHLDDGKPASGLTASLLRPALEGDGDGSPILPVGSFTSDERPYRVEVATAVIGPTGAFRLAAPRPGEYLVRIAGAAGTLAFGPRRALTSGANAPLALVVGRPASLGGRVLVPAGASATGLRVWAVPTRALGHGTPDEQTAVALDPDGRFALPRVAPGSVHVFLMLPEALRHSGGGWMSSGIGWSGERLMFARDLGTLDVPPAAALEHEFTLDDFPGTLELHVRLNGAPAPRLALLLNDDPSLGCEALGVEADDNGVFGPFALFAGTWTVRAEDPDSGWKSDAQPVVIQRARPTVATMDFERP